MPGLSNDGSLERSIEPNSVEVESGELKEEGAATHCHVLPTLRYSVFPLNSSQITPYNTPPHTAKQHGSAQHFKTYTSKS